MKLALPSYMCLTLPIFHYGPPCPSGTSSEGSVLSLYPIRITFLFLTGIAGELIMILIYYKYHLMYVEDINDDQLSIDI